MGASESWWAARPEVGGPVRKTLLLPILFLAVVLLYPPALAMAGQASAGELFFHPCTECHPVTVDDATGRPSRPIPNDFDGHGIVLEGHDKLGRGDAACIVCHDSGSRNPGKLKTVDGSLVDITGDLSLVCERCHQEKYEDFRAGTHGKDLASCVAAGCHDPHTPQYIYAGPLRPFQGTGFQFKVLPQHVAFRPLAPPAPAPAVNTPTWYAFAAVAAYLLALLLAVGLVTTVVRGRQQR